MKKGRAGTFTHDYKRHGTTTLFAALNVFEGTVMGKCYPRHRHTEFFDSCRDRPRNPRRSRRASHRRQLLSPQTRTGEEVVGPSSTFPRAFHPHLFILAQLGGAVLSRDNRQAHSSWNLSQRARVDEGHLRLPRTLQPACEALCVDQDCKASTNSLLSTQRVDNWT